MPQRLLDSENQHDFDWADSAYSGKCFEELLSLGGFESLIHEKRARNHPIRDADKELNRIKSAIRGLVCLWRHDHVNGWKAHEKIGLERMEAWWGLNNLAFNLFRYLKRTSNGAIAA